MFVAMVIAPACGREQEPETSLLETVTGIVVEVVPTSIVVTGTLRVKDENGRVWSFDGRDYRGFTPSHLREHMLLGLGVLVRFRRDNVVLRVVEIRDAQRTLVSEARH